MGLGREQESGRHNWSGLGMYAWKPLSAILDFTLSERDSQKNRVKG